MGKRRYELAEEILRRGGTDEEIQSRIMEEFPNSRENPTRAQWYRRSWNKYGHCRGDRFCSDNESHADDSCGQPPVPSTVEQGATMSLEPGPVLGIAQNMNLTTLEQQWLEYAWSVVADKKHIWDCEQHGGSGIEDQSLRWPGYLGKLYKPGGLLLIANIHRDFASGCAGHDLASQLVTCTKTWRDVGRSAASDWEYLTANRSCYMRGLKLWTVGSWFEKVLNRVGLNFEQVVYLNAARCQAFEGACQTLQRLCLRRFPLSHLETILCPKLILTCSTVVRGTASIAPKRWFNQRNGLDEQNRSFKEWSELVLNDIT